MQLTKILLKSSILISIAIVLTSCQKDSGQVEDDSQPLVETSIHLSGLLATDVTGAVIGYYGNISYLDEDWKHDSIWDENEWEALNFEDTVDLSGTYLDHDNNPPSLFYPAFAACFPNPAVDVTSFYFRIDGIAKVKACIVDSSFKRIYTISAKDSIINIHANLKDSLKMEPSVLYRLYYAFSINDSLNFYKGHGDIMWCDEYYPITNCLEYIP